MKVTDKILVILILLFLTACFDIKNRISLDKPINISYHTRDVSMEIVFNSRKVINNKNYYFGVLKSQLLSKQRPKEIILTYKNQESQIYYDSSISASVGFWRRSNWNIEGSRNNKIYVVFNEDNLTSEDIEIITKDVPEDIEEMCSHEKYSTCDLFNKLRIDNKKR